MPRVKRDSAKKNVPRGNLTVEEKYNIQAKLDDQRFDIALVKEMAGEQFTIDYIHKNGFSNPVCFLDKSGLGQYTAVSFCSNFSDLSAYILAYLLSYFTNSYNKCYQY